jgi:tetratricopeptide (TPR) repeat protein
MLRLGRRKKSYWLLAIFVPALLAPAVLMLVRSPLSADPNARLESSYASRDWARTSELARDRLKLFPDDPETLRLAARAAARQDRDQRALSMFRRLPPEKKNAEDWFLVGRSMVRQGQRNPAFDAYEEALKQDPNHPEALAGLAGLYMQIDRFHGAAQLASRLARQPDWEARAQVLLGTALSQTNDSAGATRALARWARLDPQGRVIQPNPVGTLEKLLARSFLQSGQAAEAKRVVEAMLKRGEDPEAAWLLSRCFIQEKDWERAGEVFRKYPSHGPENPLEPEPAPYSGASSCAPCHRAEFDAVMASRHATTFYRARDLGALPLPPSPLPDPGDPEVIHEFHRQGNSLIVKTTAKERIQQAVIDYAFGSLDHFTTLVGRDDEGRSRMVRMSYYRSHEGTGWDRATGLPLQPPDREEYLGTKMFEGDGVRRCLYCHTTNLYAILHETGPEAADRSIGCERCHGPGSHHIAAVAADFPDLAIPRTSDAAPASLDQICASCHGIKQPQGLDVPRTDPIWLRFQSLTLTWSRCYTESEGQLGCVTCHDPHRNVETSVEHREARCLSCHDPGTKPAPAGFSSGATSNQQGVPAREKQGLETARTLCPVNPARGCIDCHMPSVWVESTHSYKWDHFIRIHDQPPAPSGATGRIGHE